MQKKYSIFFGCLIAISLIAKIIFLFSGSLPWGDDLYYWLWFQHPFFSYPDHPPLIGYFVGLSTLIFGHHTYALALGGFILYAFFAVLGYFLAANLFVPRSRLAGFLFATSIATVPYFAGISVIMAPDTVLIFFIFLTLFAYHNAFFRQENCARAWIFAGIFLSLAFFSKLTTFFLGLAIFFYAIASKNRKKYLRNPYFYLSFLPSVIVGVILLVSDSSHDWMMLKYSSMRATLKSRLDLYPNFLYNQLKMYSPFLFILFTCLSYVNVKNYYFASKKNPQKSIKEDLFFFSFVSMFLLSFIFIKRYQSYMHSWWAAFSVCSGFILILYYLVDHWHQRKIRIFTSLNFAWCTFYVSLAIFHIMFGVISYNYEPKYDKNPIVSAYNTFLRKTALISRETFSQKIDDVSSDHFHRFNPIKDGTFREYYEKNMRKDLPFLTKTFFAVGYLAFYFPEKKDIFAVSKKSKIMTKRIDYRNMYDQFFDINTLRGKDTYFILNLDLPESPEQKIRTATEEGLHKNFEKVTKMKSFYSYRKHKPISRMIIYYCQNYQGISD